MITQRNRIEAFCWTTLVVLIITSCLGIVPWWSTAGYAVAATVFLRILLWGAYWKLGEFMARYETAVQAIRGLPATLKISRIEDAIRHWATLDAEISRRYRLDDDEQ